MDPMGQQTSLAEEPRTEAEEEWSDVSHILIEGTNQLTKDEVLLLPGMALIDIISAIQIMDPRMDVGFGRSKKHAPDDDQQFKAEQDLLPSEVMMIIDISLACEVTWYSGRLLPQTILMSNYLRHLDQLEENPNRLIKHVLRAYLLGLSKCCSVVSDETFKGHLRENEDIHFEHHTIDFNEDIDVTQTLYELDQAYAILNAWPDEIEGYRMPLMERLRFRIEYLYSLALLSCSPTTSTISQLEIHLRSASEALECIRLQTNSDKSISILDQSDRVKSAFDLNFVQIVSSHSPPRPVDILKSLYQLLSMTTKIIEDLSSITQIGLGSSISDWMTFFQGFSRQNPMALPFVRSYLLSLFQDGNVIALDKDHTLDWLARECISSFSAGRVRLESNGVEIRYILNRLAGLIVNYLSAFAANRSRGRRMLSNSLIEWKVLYRATLSNRLGIPPSTLQTIQTLMYYFSIETGLQIILMGFDLELYDDHHDRLSMWWVVQRLSERSCELLKILSGGQESLEVTMMGIIGKLGAAAMQIARKKDDEANTESSSNRRRTTYERRIKCLTSFRANFEDTDLVDHLDLPKNLLHYPEMLQNKSLDSDQLHSCLENVRDQLKSIDDQAHLQKKIGLKQFKFFIQSLIKSTNDLIFKNSHRDHDDISLGKLKISHQFDELHVPQKDEIDDQVINHVSSSFLDLGRFDDVSSKWFLT